MAARTITSLALASYVRDVVDGQPIWAHGFRGDVVDVHDSDVGRFDALASEPEPGEADETPEPEPSHAKRTRTRRS